MTNPKYREKHLAYYRIPINRFKQAVSSSIKRKLEWNIEFESFLDLINKPCFYCKGKLPETGTGLDRKDSKRGYLINNVVPCCTECNLIKNEYISHDEMVEVAILLKKLRDKF